MHCALNYATFMETNTRSGSKSSAKGEETGKTRQADVNIPCRYKK